VGRSDDRIPKKTPKTSPLGAKDFEALSQGGCFLLPAIAYGSQGKKVTPMDVLKFHVTDV